MGLLLFLLLVLGLLLLLLLLLLLFVLYFLAMASIGTWHMLNGLVVVETCTRQESPPWTQTNPMTSLKKCADGASTSTTEVHVQSTGPALSLKCSEVESIACYTH